MKTTISILKTERNLLDKFYDSLVLKLSKYTVDITEERSDKRAYMNFNYSRENSVAVLKIIKAFLCAVYCVAYKRRYIAKGLANCEIPSDKREVLIQTLVSFNREEEFALVGKDIEVGKRFAVDGYYNFKMDKVKSNWNESIKVTKSNSDLLDDDASFNLLLRFLLSTVEPKSESVVIKEEEGGYLLFTANKKVLATNEEELMLALVDIAPIEVCFTQTPKCCETFCQLSEIFEVKNENTGYCFV